MQQYFWPITTGKTKLKLTLRNILFLKCRKYLKKKIWMSKEHRQTIVAKEILQINWNFNYIIITF